jgi:hypothetical protein
VIPKLKFFQIPNLSTCSNLFTSLLIEGWDAQSTMKTSSTQQNTILQRIKSTRWSEMSNEGISTSELKNETSYGFLEKISVKLNSLLIDFALGIRSACHAVSVRIKGSFIVIKFSKLVRIDQMKNTFLSAAKSERGDVPGWVLVVLMTTGLVTGIWTVAQPRLSSILKNSLDNMNSIR